MKDLRMAITTCDHYHKHLRVTLHQLQKYWSPLPSIDIIGFKSPDFNLPDGVRFLSMGSQSDYPVEKWSDPVIKYLQDCNQDVIALYLDDYQTTRWVDTRMVEVLADYLRQFKFVLKMDLAEDRLHSWAVDLDYSEINYDTDGHIDLIKSDPRSEYQMSLWPGLWNVEHLLRVLWPNASPWQLEIEGTSRVRNMTDVIVLGTKQSIVQIHLGARGGRGAGEISIDGLKPEDQQELRELGLV